MNLHLVAEIFKFDSYKLQKLFLYKFKIKFYSINLSIINNDMRLLTLRISIEFLYDTISTTEDH